MKRTLLFAVLFTMLFTMLVATVGVASAQWQPAGDKIKTRWAATVDPDNAWPEYPRPIMQRADWMNLNGLWDYAIRPMGEVAPETFDGSILVPFAAESSLSGVMKTVGDGNELWYTRTFSVPREWTGKDVLLHFEAVDWRADVWINDVFLGSHEGGYAPFSFDVTPFIGSGKQKLVVRVWDPTNDGPQPRGKQVKEPRGIWYTPVTGIWQTVWLEPVNPKHIESVKITPDIDRKEVSIEADVAGAQRGDVIEGIVRDRGAVVASGRSVIGQPIRITIADPKLWSPDSPFLYDLEVRVVEGSVPAKRGGSPGKAVDAVQSYFAMRKISTQRDEHGIVRMQLNNEDLFMYGTLDQGWWPDGLYTAPTDEALRYDIEKTKAMGFNTIRKHVKVEPARWYLHCDQLGMLVWQDMPSGDGGNGWQMRKLFDGNEFARSPRSEEIYRHEWKEIVDNLYSYPSIVVWVPFNEAWGQFKTVEIAEWTKRMDRTRLVNSASGGNHLQAGDILDIHNYPEPKMYLYDAGRATVLGEYGGIGLALEGHLWNPENNWGYVQFKTSEEVTDQYVKFAGMLKELVRAGFSAAIYTQTTDVEGEVNGLMTYDREVDKLDVARVFEANQAVIDEGSFGNERMME